MGGNRIEPDIRKENNRRPRKHSNRRTARSCLSEQCVTEKAYPGVSKRRKRMPVRRVDVKRSHSDHKKDDREFHNDHPRIKSGAFLDAYDEDGRNSGCDKNCRHVEKRAGRKKTPRVEIKIERGVGKRIGKNDSKTLQQVLKVRRPAVRHRR